MTAIHHVVEKALNWGKNGRLADSTNIILLRCFGQMRCFISAIATSGSHQRSWWWFINRVLIHWPYLAVHQRKQRVTTTDWPYRHQRAVCRAEQTVCIRTPESVRCGCALLTLGLLRRLNKPIKPLTSSALSWRISAVDVQSWKSGLSLWAHAVKHLSSCSSGAKSLLLCVGGSRLYLQRVS